jgi:hypothetical protein
LPEIGDEVGDGNARGAQAVCACCGCCVGPNPGDTTGLPRSTMATSPADTRRWLGGLQGWSVGSGACVRRGPMAQRCNISLSWIPARFGSSWRRRSFSAQISIDRLWTACHRALDPACSPFPPPVIPILTRFATYLPGRASDAESARNVIRTKAHLSIVQRRCPSGSRPTSWSIWS